MDGIFLLRVVATLLVGCLGSFLAKRLRFPAPGIAGAMIAVLLFSILSGQAAFPQAAKPMIQAIAGGVIGIQLDREALRGLQKLLRPVLVYLLLLFSVSLCIALLLSVFTSLTPVTALLASAPGGIVDMSMLSYDYEAANTSYIAVLHMVRLLVALGIFPFFTRAYLRRTGAAKETAEPEAETGQPSGSFLANTLPTLAVMAAGGALGQLLGLPAGPLTFAMIATGAFQVGTGRARKMPRLRWVAQIGAGTMVATTMTPEDLRGLLYLPIPILFLLVEFLLINFLIGPFLARRFHLDLSSMLLACNPAGSTDMALIADDMGGDSAVIAIFQIARLAAVLVVYPYIAQLFAMF